VTLTGGLSFRKLLPGEAAKLSGHFDRLTPDESLFRFMGSMGHKSVGEHCERINWFRTIVIGCFEAGELRGSAEIHTDGRLPMSCEVAIAVETAWQERGIATELLHRALVIARNRAAREVRIYSLADNHRIQNVARKFGARFTSRAGQSDASILLPVPTCASLCEEVVDDGFGWMSLWFEPIAASLRFVPATAEGRSTGHAR
jgi:GNAT superfamily N-acetyltransferase